MRSSDAQGGDALVVSGAGIAGLTFATLAARAGRRVVVVERAPSLRTGGYMIDFFGIGWDVADRMGLLSDLRAITYPIEHLEYVDREGRPYARTTLERMREALDGRYTPLLRSDLERLLYGAALREGVEIRFGTEILSIAARDGFAHVALSDGTRILAPLVVGADGVHSGVRRLAFPASSWTGRPLGYFVTAFRTQNRYGIARRIALFEGADRLAGFYPVAEEVMDSFFVVRCGPTEEGDGLERVLRRFRPGDWICTRVLQDARETERYEDALVQIRMQSWSRERVVLIGDACGCPTLIAGQGAHLAMGGAYVLARELERTNDVAAACRKYEQVLHAHTDSVQDGAARFARSFVPGSGTWAWLRRAAIRMALSRWFLRSTISGLGRTDLIRRYDHDG